MNRLSALARPIVDALKLAAKSPAAWWIGALVAAGYMAQWWIMAASAFAPATAGSAAIGFIFLILTARWWLTRLLTGPGLPRGRFWPWIGIMLVTLLVYSVSGLALGITSSRTDIGQSDGFQFLSAALQVVLTVAMMPAFLWATLYALGRKLSFSKVMQLPDPGFIGYLVNYLLVTGILRFGAIALVDRSMASDGSMTNGGIVIGGLITAVAVIMDIAFLTAAVDHIGDVSNDPADVFG